MSLERVLPEFVRSRYALKLLGVSLLIVLVITALATVTVFQVSDRVSGDQLDSVETNAELEARALGQWIDGKQQVIRALSNHEALTPLDRSRTQATLEGELAALSLETESLAVVERSPNRHSNGTRETIIASTEASVVGEPLATTDVDWKPEIGFNFDDTDDVRLSWVYTDGNATLVALASPTQDGEHVLMAEYRTGVRAERFTSALPGTETLVLGGFTAFVLFDERGPSDFRPYTDNRSNSTIGRAILDSDPTSELNGSVLTDTEVKGYHSVPGDKVDWVVVKEVPRSAALAVTDRVERDLWLLVALVVAGFLLVGLVIQRGPIRSVQELARQANALADGDLSVDVERGKRIDEVGEVRAAFGNTKDYIQTIADQAEALSRQAFDAAVLDADIPGRVGESMATMQRDLQHFITRLEVLNRVLRHNLRNEVDVIKSHAEGLDESERREGILAATDRLTTLGARARRIDRIMSTDPKPERIDLADRFATLIADLDTGTVEVTTDVPADASIVTDETALTAVLQSPLENAVTHAESRVSVSADVTPGGCTIEIHDDGPGIPDAELAALAADGERPLQHSRGLGLWELQWAVEALGGDLAFDTTDGTTVEISLPDLGPE
jgi:methyl-accepting chemotaxis protein